MSGSLMRPFQPSVVRGYSGRVSQYGMKQEQRARRGRKGGKGRKRGGKKRTHLFEVSPHNHHQLRVLLTLLLQQRRVLLSLVDVVNRARTDDDDDLVGVAPKNGGDLGARTGDGALGGVGEGELGLEEGGLDKGLDLRIGRGRKTNKKEEKRKEVSDGA
jgi:hypothetical protein